MDNNNQNMTKIKAYLFEGQPIGIDMDLKFVGIDPVFLKSCGEKGNIVDFINSLYKENEYLKEQIENN